MTEAKKSAFPVKIIPYLIVAVLIGLLFLTMFNGISSYRKTRNSIKAAHESHIKTVMTIDRNCNDCHLGASFVNLFSHEAVKNNDNVVIFIMNKVNIKRW